MAFDTTQTSHRQFRQILKERTTPVVIWAGAGLSAPAGLPTWLSLRDTLFQAADQKLATLDDEGQKRPKALVALAKTETSLWSAFAHLHRALGDTTWVTTIRNAFQNAFSVTIPQALC